MSTFGDNIKEIRLYKNYTLKDVENSTGISNQNLSRWERGEVLPNIDFCIQLAEFYGISLDELVGISDTPQKQSAASLPAKLKSNQLSFVREYSEVIDDENYINMSKLYKNISPSLRALALGYIVGLLQNNGIDTKKILGY